jgi:hypothetical protein
MKKLLLILAVLLLAAVALNPGAEAHRARLKAAVGERNQLAGLLGVGHLAAFASTYHSVGLGSYTTLDGKVVTLGAFGFVFVPDLPAR